MAVKNVDKLGIIQIYANVRWPYIAANDQHMLKRGPEINLADPNSYPLIRASLIKQIEGGDMLSTW